MRMAPLLQRSARPLFAAIAFAAGGVACSSNGPDNTMNSQRLISAPTVTTYHDTQRAEVFVVTAEGGSRELITIQFFEKRPDLGEIERLKQANWTVKVPEGQALFIATAGQRRDALKTSWVGWRDQTMLNGLSLFLEKPLSVPINSTDRLIDPPVIVQGRMHLYFFRLDRDEAQLWRHEFTGDMGQSGACLTKKLLALPAFPTVGALAPIAGPAGEVVVAWMEAGNNGMRVGTTLIKGEPGPVLRTEALPQLRPLERMRLGVYAVPGAPARVRGVAQALDGSTYQLFEAVCDLSGAAANAQTQQLKLPKNSLHSAASFYLKQPEEAQSFTCLLSKQGVLLLYADEQFRELRRGVPLEYDFPVVTTLGARHEATVNAQGDIVMKTIN